MAAPFGVACILRRDASRLLATIGAIVLRNAVDPAFIPSPSTKSLAPLYWGLVVTAALVAVIVAAIFWVSARNQSDNAWVRHTLAIRGELSDVLTLVEKAESAQRGYLLTGRDEYLLPYNNAIEQLPSAINQTGQLIGDNPRQQQTFGRLRQLINEKLKELTETIDDRKAGRTDAALAFVNTDEGLSAHGRDPAIFRRDEGGRGPGAVTAAGRRGNLRRAAADGRGRGLPAHLPRRRAAARLFHPPLVFAAHGRP